MSAQAEPAMPQAPLHPLDASQQEASQLLLDLDRTLALEPVAARPSFLSRLRWNPEKGRQPIRGLYLWGGVGRGKTYLMDWFVDSLLAAGKRRLHFHHFMRAIHDAMARLPRQPDPLEVVADQWRRDVRVLCLDEFVVSDIADAMILHRLLAALFARGMVLVTTSNTSPAALYPNGLQRPLFLPAIALIERYTQVFELDGGQDYRLRALTQAGVYFDGDDREARLAACFEGLTGGHWTPGTALLVNGRSMPVRRLGTDVLWFDYASLCGTPRAAADYIEIAREYNTLLLSDLPQLEPPGEAAARRFVHLVDELYDQRVKLVISAQVPLASLYQGGIAQFPHERMQSRLVEMQSSAYLAAARGGGIPGLGSISGA